MFYPRILMRLWRTYCVVTFLFLCVIGANAETPNSLFSANLANEPKALSLEKNLHDEVSANIANDDLEGEDLEARQVALEALGSAAGTVVVMDAQNGQILTVINQDWAAHGNFKPCSTIKLVTAFGGLTENVIDPNGDVGFPMNLTDALAYSNNGYFQKVGSSLGAEKMNSYAQMLGLGQPTGVNLLDENFGKTPYSTVRNARIFSHGDDFEVTPFQLATLVSAITNGGKLLTPHIPKTRTEQVAFRGTMRKQLRLQPIAASQIVSGMIGSVSYGTGKLAAHPNFTVAGKTGSCIENGTWIGLFASVAPVNNPRLAVVVITRGTNSRGKYAAAIAGKIYRGLTSRLKAKISTTPLLVAKQTQIYSQPQPTSKPLPVYVPKPKIDAQTSAKIDLKTKPQQEISRDDDFENDDMEETSTVAKPTRTLPVPKDAYEPIIISSAKQNPKQIRSESRPQVQTSNPNLPPIVINSNGTRPRYATKKAN